MRRPRWDALRGPPAGKRVRPDIAYLPPGRSVSVSSARGEHGPGAAHQPRVSRHDRGTDQARGLRIYTGPLVEQLLDFRRHGRAVEDFDELFDNGLSCSPPWRFCGTVARLRLPIVVSRPRTGRPRKPIQLAARRSPGRRLSLCHDRQRRDLPGAWPSDGVTSTDTGEATAPPRRGPRGHRPRSPPWRGWRGSHR